MSLRSLSVVAGGPGPDFADTSKNGRYRAWRCVMAGRIRFPNEYKREAVQLVTQSGIWHR